MARIAPAFSVGLVYAAIVAARSSVSFPFARTLVDCGSNTPANMPRSSDDWSGSYFCADKDKTVGDATFIRGCVPCQAACG